MTQEAEQRPESKMSTRGPDLISIAGLILGAAGLVATGLIGWYLLGFAISLSIAAWRFLSHWHERRDFARPKSTSLSWTLRGIRKPGFILSMAALITFSFLLAKSGNKSDGVTPQVPGSPTSQPPEKLPSSSPPPPTSVVPPVQIVEPIKDKSVGYEAGTEVKGTAFNLGNKSLWLFQLSESPQGGLAYYIASELIPVVNGEWSTQVNQIGSPDGQREFITFVAALADQNCATMIKALQAKPDDDQYFQDFLPLGSEVAASFRVVKDRA
jgi:hypothetical protein